MRTSNTTYTHKVKNTILLIVPGSFVAGLLTYLILSYLYMPAKISVALSIIISTLIFGLNMYYLLPRSNMEDTRNVQRQYQKTSHSTVYAWLNFIFIWISGIVISILIVSSTVGHSDYVLFVPWQQMTSYDIIKLVVAIAFSFFLPGYTLLGIMDKNYRLSLSLRLLLSYLISILFVALPGYIVASLGYAGTDAGLFVIAIFVAIFALFILRQFRTLRGDFRYVLSVVHRKPLSTWNALTNRIPHLVVFVSLLGLVVFYTYYLNDGVIITDQWFHHGRALLISSQLYKDNAISEFYKDPYEDSGSDVTQIYPPIFSSLLAGFFDLTDSASVNAYASIGFLNAIPFFAFYYFFTRWVPANKRKAAILATTLFVLSSGFGWMYAVNLATVSPPSNEIEPEISSINILALVTDTAYDIGLPTTFINVGHPDITTPLIIIALPAGFTLLGMIKEVTVKKEEGSGLGSPVLKKSTGTTIRISLLITLISFLGILSHDEFYLFIIVACVAIVILLTRPSIERSFQQPKGIYRNTILHGHSIFFSSFLAAMFLVALVDTFISPTEYYITREIFGVPLISLCFIFVLCSWAIYVVIYIVGSKNISFTRDIKDSINKNYTHVIRSSSGIGLRADRLRLAMSVSAVSAVAFLYLFAFLVWSELPNEDIQLQIDTENEWNVPSYLYPMKFGLTGLLGLAFLLSYLFKKFDKEVFVFGILAIIALLAGPYYDEHRFGKYIMAGMASFASLLIYEILSKSFSGPSFIQLKVVSGGILVGLVITFSGLSIFVFAGFVELFTNVSDFNEGTRRDFPTNSEIQLLEFLHSRVVTGKPGEYYNIALPEKQVDNNRGFLTKIYGFTPVPRAKLLQTPLVLNASTIETFYNLLDYSGTKYIILSKKDLSSADNSTISNIYSSDSIIHFALENFQKAYEDNNYVVLEVPALSSPSPQGDVALIYPKSELLPHSLVSDTAHDNDNKNNTSTMVSILQFDTPPFKGIDNLEFVKVENESNNALLNGYKDGRVVLWSDLLKPQHHDLNTIEATFRIIGENNTSNDAGILWDVGNKEYTVSIRNDRLEILVESNDVSNSNGIADKRLINVRDIERENGLWYTLKVMIAEDIINIYVNDMLAVRVPVDNYPSDSRFDQKFDGGITNPSNNASSNVTVDISNNSTISRVGIFSFDNIAEFKPIILRQVSFDLSEKEKKYYHHYYPLTMLALSKIGYNTYIEGDLSAFSKKYVILPYDPLLNGSYNCTGEKVVLNNPYLDYARNGGNLIVIDSVDYSKYDMNESGLRGVFSRLLSISTTGNSTIFNGLSNINSVGGTDRISGGKNIHDPGELDQQIQNQKRHYGVINISGIAEGNIFGPLDTNEDIIVKSHYVNTNTNTDNNKSQNSIKLITIEKKCGDGRIIYVNAADYFQTLFSGPSTNNTTYLHSNNKYFSTLANITNLIDPNLAKEVSFSESNFLNAAGSLGATPIRQIVDNIRISPGYRTIINSSSLLFPANDNSNVILAPEEVTFSSSVRSAPFSDTGLIKENTTIYGSRIQDKVDLPFQRNNESNDYSYSFKNAKVKNLKIFGTYQVVVESKAGDKILIPTFPSYSDYVSMNIPDGFDLTIKLSDSKPSYTEFEVLGENNEGDSSVNSTFQKLRVYGHEVMDIGPGGGHLASIRGNEIYFQNINSDFRGEDSTTLLMKNPMFQIIQEGEKRASDTFLEFKRNSPEGESIKIDNEGSSKESVVFSIDYADSYSQAYHEGIRNHHLTYIEEDIKVAENNTSKGVAENSLGPSHQASTWLLDIRLPGDISERAKENGAEVQWQKAMTSYNNLLSATLIIISAIISTKLAIILNRRSKLKLPSRG